MQRLRVASRPTLVWIAGTVVLSAISGCLAWLRPTPAPQVTVSLPVQVFPLPGGLDPTRIFNSNSPEVVQTEGILLSTLPPRDASDSTALDTPFQGDFRYFSHHIAKDPTPGARLLTLGLIAANRGSRPVELGFEGSSYLSQPDAPFIELLPILPDPDGTIFAGPGDRVATDLLHGRASLPWATMSVAPGASLLVASWSIPTDVVLPPPINGRNTELKLKASGPIYLAEVATFAPRLPDGRFAPPRPGDYLRVLAARTLAGPREATPSATPPGPPPKGRFLYGRVAGVSLGDRWEGTLATARMAVGDRLGVPIASTYLHRLGTDQDQSAPLLVRYPDTATQAHGNYGVTYDLDFRLANPDSRVRTYAFALGHPTQVASASATFLSPPNHAVTFRGPVRLTWLDPEGFRQTRFTHLVLHQGELSAPFETVQVPPGGMDARITLVYPADATPPQLLMLTRL